jgi:NADH-quinone oxidoreductase subunit J
MSPSVVFFYLLSAFILTSGLLAVTSKKIFRAAIWLLFSLIGIAGFYFMMRMEFIAAVQIIVYVGGIVVLIIFSIFLTQHSGLEMQKPVTGRIFFSLLLVGLGAIFTYWLILQYPFRPSPVPATEISVSNIGSQMLSTSEHGYVLPFEVVSILLLSAMIGCIVIAIKIKPGEK